ncbi:MAG: sulfite exporter TauE/SafE family protein [Alphaproteobacteria bacterium]|nr:sulfite exporter TauE/SafE family protein [Alphaproteobacteria bacterium]MDE2112435.1 sulfite exporter TauE/SafE family protein [Alphaproteobacteria bacterium]MDE2494062.1 sulfite exporter TauE/SafE family protein [Alphaproteobacteria bacterium]
MDFLTVMGGNDFGTLALGLVIAGVVSGLVAGMLGVGGGIVIVPVMYQVLAAMAVPENLRMHIAVGTSLATIIPTSISSLRAHSRKGAVDWELLKRWAAPMLIGVVAGSVLAGWAPGQMLALFFGLMALPLATNMAFGKESWRLAERLPRGIGGAALPFGIGGVSAMMGIGGGMLGVPSMTLCGVPIHRAVGTASAFGAIISIPGTIGAAIAGFSAAGLPPYSLGYANLFGFLLIAPVSFFVAPAGAAIAHMADAKRLRRVFALFIAVTAIKMLWDVLS